MHIISQLSFNNGAVLQLGTAQQRQGLPAHTQCDMPRRPSPPAIELDFRFPDLGKHVQWGDSIVEGALASV